MKSQQLTRRCVIERPVRVADDVGGFATTWELFRVAWCEPQFASSANGLQFSRNDVQTTVDFIVRMEVANSIDPTFRLFYKDKVYVITGIRPMNGETFAVLNCATSD